MCAQQQIGIGPDTPKPAAGRHGGIRTRGRRAAACLAAWAALLLPSVEAAEILIGQTSGFTGAVAAGARETTDGALLYLEHVNGLGGIHGQRIKLVSLDDKFETKLAAENARTLITEHDVLALFLNRGTPQTQSIMPLLTQHKIVLIAPSTGAMILHKPVHPWLFNVRATYQREAEKAVEHLTTIGITRIGMLLSDDAFGADCAEGAHKGFDKAKLQPSFIEKFNRTQPDFDPIAKVVAQKNPQAILFFGSAGSVASGTKVIREHGSRAQIITASNNASSGFIKLMGEHARGTIVSQVFPNERSLATPMIKEAQEIAAARGLKEVTPAMLEGYAGAKVLVEGLRRAGPNPTRSSLQQALNGMRKVDIGGLEVSFSEADHTGLDFADLSIIGRDGKFVR